MIKPENDVMCEIFECPNLAERQIEVEGKYSSNWYHVCEEHGEGSIEDQNEYNRMAALSNEGDRKLKYEAENPR